jgi:hypothetical protein
LKIEAIEAAKLEASLTAKSETNKIMEIQAKQIYQQVCQTID